MESQSQIARIKYQAIEALTKDPTNDYTVSGLTKLLGLTRQAYYKGIAAPVSPRQAWHERATQEVKKIFEQHGRRIGSYNLTGQINRVGVLPRPIGRRLVITIMHEQNLRCLIRIKKHDRVHQNEVYIQDNLLNRDFNAQAPNQKWLFDTTVLTYGLNDEYQVRLSGVLDLYGRRLIATCIGETETTDLVVATFKKAFKNSNAPHVMIHTDRGAAYTSRRFCRYIERKGAVKSMSRPATPCDNSPMERWWNDFKLRWMESHPRPQTLKQLKKLVADGVTYFNQEVRSSKREWKTPDEFFYDYKITA